MKKYFIIGLIVFNITVFAQSKNQLVKVIRDDYITIENELKQNLYTKQSVDYDAREHNQYGTVTLYTLTKSKQFEKLYVKTLYYDENCYEVSFYSKNGILFFIYQVSEIKQNVNDDFITWIKEDRYYFHKQKLIMYLYKEYKLPQKSSQVNNEEKPLSTVDTKELFNKYNTVREILKNPKTDKRVLY